MNQYPYIVIRVTNSKGRTFDSAAWLTTHPKVPMDVALIYKDPTEVEEQILDRGEMARAVVTMRGNDKFMADLKKAGYNLKEA